MKHDLAAFEADEPRLAQAFRCRLTVLARQPPRTRRYPAGRNPFGQHLRSLRPLVGPISRRA